MRGFFKAAKTVADSNQTQPREQKIFEYSWGIMPFLDTELLHGTWEIRDGYNEGDKDSESNEAVLFEKWLKEVVFSLQKWPNKWVKVLL